MLELVRSKAKVFANWPGLYSNKYRTPSVVATCHLSKVIGIPRISGDYSGQELEFK